jgi:hypothetical protein
MKTGQKPNRSATATVTAPAAAVNNHETKPATGHSLETLEAAFEQAYTEAGAILAQIRARKLYAPKFETFAEYAQKRWQVNVPMLWKKVWGAAQKAVAKEAKTEAKAEAKTEAKAKPAAAKKAATK